MPTTNIICITPVRNEAWILKNFIESAKTWADVIIVGDNRSADDSVAIAQNAGCRVIDLGPTFGEHNRRKRLIDEARKIPGRRLIFALDADEALSTNWSQSLEWSQMLNAAPGQRFSFDLIEPLPGLEKCSIGPYPVELAFLDDGVEFRGTEIHGPRIPSAGPLTKLSDIKLLHYIAIDPERMFSRHRWYKCLEYIEHKKRPWEICVRYQDVNVKTYDSPIVPFERRWTDGYTWLDDYRSKVNTPQESYWWDGEVLNYFDQYGPDRFRKINIWDVDWNKKAEQLRRNAGRYEDPRSPGEKLTHRFIQKHREQLKLKRELPFKLVDKLAKTALKLSGW